MEEIIHPKGKIYYSVGEVCELFGVAPSLLRFWEESFPILKIAKNSRGHRIYSTTDVDNLRLIYHLVKEQGMTLEGAKKRLRGGTDSIRREAEIVERLRGVRNMLAALKSELSDDVEVIDVDDYADVDAAEATVVAEVMAPTEEVTEVVAPAEDVALAEDVAEALEETMAEVTAPAEEVVLAVEAPKEQLADFKMEMPSSNPQPEEPKKRAPKVGTLIGGDLFDPQDVRMAVAKKNAKEAKKQVVEQTLF